MQPAEAPAPRDVTYLVDLSRSMGLPSAGDDGCSRLERLARTWLSAEALTEARARASLSIKGFDDGVRTLNQDELAELKTGGRGSSIAGGLRTILTEDQRGVEREVVLLSDGVDTDGVLIAGLGEEFRRAGVRVHAAPAGRAARTSDLGLRVRATPEFVHEGEEVLLEVVIDQQGFEGQPVRLVVHETDAEPRVVAEREVRIQGRTRVEIPLRPRGPERAGAVAARRYTAEIEALEPERDAANNRDEVFVQCASPRVRVAVFEGEPSRETRWFIESLSADADIDLTAVHAVWRGTLGAERRARVTRIVPAPGGTEHRTETLDTGADAGEALENFDVVVIGRHAERAMTAAQRRAVPEYVRTRGGSVVFLRPPGDDASSELMHAVEIAELSPLEWEAGTIEARVSATDEGSRAGLGELDVIGEVVARASVARGWARELAFGEAVEDGVEHAAIAWGTRGLGRVAAVSIDRWSNAATRASWEGVWRSLLRMLLARDVNPAGLGAWISVERAAVETGERLGAQVFVRSGAPSAMPELTLTRPSGAVESVELDALRNGSGAWSAQIDARDAGSHVLSVLVDGEQVAESGFVARRTDTEMRDLSVRRDELALLAEATGGGVFEPEDWREFLAQLEGGSSAAPGRREPLLDPRLVFALAASMLVLEWFLRRREGLA